ncbi:M48 family metallopeptidase, partial [Brachybacterium hainanense]
MTMHPPQHHPGGQGEAPNLINGATRHGILGPKGVRHPWELPLLGVGVVLTLAGYLLWLVLVVMTLVNLIRGEGPTIFSMAEGTGLVSVYAMQIFVIVMFVPIIIWFSRAMLYAQQRANSVRMSPTQFPEGYRIVAEAAAQFGLRRVPDAYVAGGNGVINAFAFGHGFRRSVVVYSDMFEVGGEVRDPEALRFVIGHEVGHLAAGHVSYLRIVLTSLLQYVPILSSALSRTQEYTADNFGYAYCPSGALGAMGVLSGGKYLNADVNVHELADRAAWEKGLWVHLVNWQSSHPIITWRAHALRDRSRAGHLWFRPGDALWGILTTPGAWFRGPLPAGSEFSGGYPTPETALAMLDAADGVRPAGAAGQFGRFNGADYSSRVPMRVLQLSAPLLSTPLRGGGPQGPGGGPVGPAGPTGGPGGPTGGPGGPTGGPGG